MPLPRSTQAGLFILGTQSAEVSWLRVGDEGATSTRARSQLAVAGSQGRPRRRCRLLSMSLPVADDEGRRLHEGVVDVDPKQPRI